MLYWVERSLGKHTTLQMLVRVNSKICSVIVKRKSESSWNYSFCGTHLHWYATIIRDILFCIHETWYKRAWVFSENLLETELIHPYRIILTVVWNIRVDLFWTAVETGVQCEEICMPVSFICTRDSDAQIWSWTISCTWQSPVSFLYDECPECGIHTWHICKPHGLSCIDARSTPLPTSPDGHHSIIYNTYALQDALQRYDFNLMAYLSHAAIFTGNYGA